MLLAVKEATGVGLTVTVLVIVFEQPAAEIAV
jgi:hypothetical protein